MHNFRELKVWQKSRKLTVTIYELTAKFPEAEHWGLTNQMRRAAISIVSNIAEGCGRKTNPQLRQFLSIANGSSSELEAQVILATDLGFLTSSNCEAIISKVNEVQKMLRAFYNTLN